MDINNRTTIYQYRNYVDRKPNVYFYKAGQVVEYLYEGKIYDFDIESESDAMYINSMEVSGKYTNIKIK